MTCPNCNDELNVFVDKTTKTADGVIRRMSCFACGYQWKALNGETRVNSPRTPRLTDDAVRDILNSRTASHGFMARKYRKSREVIRHIRYGMSYVESCPDVERWDPIQSRALCTQCQNWREGRCAFEFPDPIEEGVQFARECLQFARA